MKKTLFLVLFMVLTVSLVFSVGGQQSRPGGVPEIQVWGQGSDNIRALFESLADIFNKDPKYNQTCTVSIQFLPSGAGVQQLNDRLLAAYLSGQKNTTFDLVERGGGDLTFFLNEGDSGMFLPFDPAKVPNYAGVSARPPAGANIFVPYRGTTVLMIYDSARVSNPPRTQNDLIQWIKANPSRFAYNPPDTGGAGDSFVKTMIYNFLPEEALMSDDTKWEAQWDQGFNLLKDIHPSMYRSSGRVVYTNRNQGIIDLMAEREIDLCAMWADMTITQTKSGHLPSTVKMYQLDPALTGELVGMMIPSFGRYPNEAHAFMDFLLSVEAQNLSLSQNASIPMISPSRLNPTEAAAISDLDVGKFRTQALGALTADIWKRWNEEIATLP